MSKLGSNINSGLGIELGSMSDATRNAGVSTATGTVIYNSTSNAMQVYSGNAAGWVNASELPGSSESNPAETAQEILDAGNTNNGTYWLNLGGETAKPIYCILDGSIETDFAYMRVFDDRPVSSGDTINHFYTGDTDYSNWNDIGGTIFTITHFATSTYSSSTLTKYTNNGGGLYSGLSTLSDVFAQSWIGSGFESDNYKRFGSGNTSINTSQLYLLDDNDTPCGRQTSCTATPNGLLMYPTSTSGGWPDGGGNTYGNTSGDKVTSLYVR